MGDEPALSYSVAPLSTLTWNAFAEMVERHNGIFGGCRCTDFHDCIFVDKRFRREGLATVALNGALDLIAEQGGGVVEGYPHEIGEKRMNNSFVYNGTRRMYEQAGFDFVRPKGLKNTVMRRTVQPA